MQKLLNFLFWGIISLSLTACMGSPEDIGGFNGEMPSRPEPCSPLDPNKANNPDCAAPDPDNPITPVVPAFAISAGSHKAGSSSFSIRARTAGSFVTPGKVESSRYVVRVGLQRATFDEDGN